MQPLRTRLEDEDDDDDLEQVATLTAPVPNVAAPLRGWEYRVDLLATAEVKDTDGFAARLNAKADEGWDLVEVVEAEDQRALIFRRPKQSAREHRPVGFAPRHES